jgi:hypothetical protein
MFVDGSKIDPGGISDEFFDQKIRNIVFKIKIEEEVYNGNKKSIYIDVCPWILCKQNSACCPLK